MGGRRNGGGRGGGPSVRGRLPRPFSPTDQFVLENWADGRIDISKPEIWGIAPFALQAILATRFGWPEVRLMTYTESMVSLQLMAEEKIGSVLRAQRAAAEAEQDAASDGLKAFKPPS